MPGRTWLDHKADALAEELAASGMHLDRRWAGELIIDRVRGIAAQLESHPPG